MPDPSNFDNSLTIVSLIGASVSWLYTQQATGLRGKIKADFEILDLSRKILGAEHDLSKRIEMKLERTIPYLYRADAERRGRIRWADFTLACFCVIAALTFASLGHDATNQLYTVLHYAAAAFLAFIASGAAMNAFITKHIPR